MAYTPFTWYDGPGGGTPIVASRLNAIEQGLADASEWAEGAQIESHNLDETNPPNGHFVRWENGLQVCFFRDFTPYFFDSTATYQGITLRSIDISWMFPAEFVLWDITAVINNAVIQNLDSGEYEGPVISRVTNIDEEGAEFRVFVFDVAGGNHPYITDDTTMYAVGRWKNPM